MNATVESRPTVCPLDCPDTCSLSVTVSDGHVTKVRGSSANPYTASVICEKVAHYFPDYVHGERRLRQPLLRNGARGIGTYRPVSWNEALDTIHQRISDNISRFGAETVMPMNYAGPHGRLASGSMASRFFNRLGATRLNRGPLCGLVRSTAYSSLFGNAPGMPPEQAEHADLIAVWGNNVTVSNLHFARIMKSARARGTKVVVVDPRRTRIAEQCHLHVQPLPGTDVVLALALAAEFERRDAINHTFVAKHVAGFDAYMEAARRYSLDDAARICQVLVHDLVQLADFYCATSHIALSIGNGMERSHNGGSSLRAIMALSVLRAAFGRPGSGVIARHSATFPYTDNALERPDLLTGTAREFNIVDTGSLLLDATLSPPITALFIYNHNPVCTHPDQNRLRKGLSRDDLFIVGIDVTMTDSMAYADVILPASSHFEYDDIYGAYGQTWLQRAQAVIPPVGESLPNTEIFRRLAARFGFNEPCFTDDDAALMRAALDGNDPRLDGFEADQLPLDRALLMKSATGDSQVMLDTVAPKTESGRIELFSKALEERFGCGVPRYSAVPSAHPLKLITPSSSKRTNTTFGGHVESLQMPRIEIHADDARSRNIVDGVEVEVFNNLGRVRMRAHISDKVMPGVLYSTKGTWLATSSTGQTVNALIPADLKADIMDGACYNDTFVDLTIAS